MIKNYIIHTFRKIFREKKYSLINIIGLSVGLASFIMIMLYVYDEYNYDKYHSKSDRIYRVTSILDVGGGVGEKSASQPYPLAKQLIKDYPQYIENAVRFFNLHRATFTVNYEEKTYNEKRFFFADPSVFDIFDFEIIKMKDSTSFNKEFTIIITESTAEKYFEDTDPIGKKIKVANMGEYEVVGVIKDVKSQSHFKFDFLASFSTINFFFRNKKLNKDWITNPYWTYILLKDIKYAKNIRQELPNFVEKHMGLAKNERFELNIQALTDIHLKSHLDYEITKNNNEKYVNLLIIIAILILIIASINFINLATAGAANRAKEISIKKIVGASRLQLLTQFLTESIIMAIISLLIAISLVELFLPVFNSISGKEITDDFRFKTETILGLIGIGLFTGLLSGIYPALFLSSFKPIKLLKGNFRLGTKSTKFRKVLVLVQFTISIILIISTLGIIKQIKYVHNADLGFEKKQIVIINTDYTKLAWEYENFKSELLKKEPINYITGMDYILGSNHNTRGIKIEGYSKKVQFFPALTVRADFVETFDIDIIEGKDFPKNEEKASNFVLVNEEMVSYLGLTSNKDIIGRTFNFEKVNKKVIGVYNNVNVTSLHEKVEPFIINISSNKGSRFYQTKYIAIQVKENKLDESLVEIEKLWNKYNEYRPFEYRLLQNEIDELYKSEDVLGELSIIFTILSILIAALGIWALTAYITEYRTREIGIRKVLGASNMSIVKLINVEFVVIIIISNIFAWPIAYFILEYWINSFAYRVDINLWTFVFASFISFMITVVTISQKSIEAGNKNPVDSLRYE